LRLAVRCETVMVAVRGKGEMVNRIFPPNTLTKS
jgi:hypothetical protein